MSSPEPQTVASVDGALTPQLIDACLASFSAAPQNRLAQCAVTQHGGLASCTNWDAAKANLSPSFSVSVRELAGVEGAATSQKASGRCWLFATLNVLRVKLIKKYKLGSSFELSQSYLHYWDKLERANYFLETMWSTSSEALDGRLMQWLLKAPVMDGGQWDMVANLIAKHGVVPKTAFPDSWTSKASRHMNWVITNKLREYAKKIRGMAAAGKTLAEFREVKAGMMEVIHRIVTIHLGTPPATFEWRFSDKDNKHSALQGLTPQTFLDQVLPGAAAGVAGTISLVNDPRNEYYKLYTVDYLGNVVGGEPVRYINVPMDVLRAAAMKTLSEGTPVWFGCDCGKFALRQLGLFDTGALDYEALYGTAPAMDKATRLQYGESLMTHAMVFTGYDLREGETAPHMWRVENSWGTEHGDKGYWTLSADWFNEYVYQIAVSLDSLDEDVACVASTEARALPAWDPMGSLACPTAPAF